MFAEAYNHESTIIWTDKEDWAKKQLRSLPNKKFTYNPGPSRHTCEKNPIIKPGIQKQYFFKKRNVGKPQTIFLLLQQCLTESQYAHPLNRELE